MFVLSAETGLLCPLSSVPPSLTKHASPLGVHLIGFILREEGGKTAAGSRGFYPSFWHHYGLLFLSVSFSSFESFSHLLLSSIAFLLSLTLLILFIPCSITLQLKKTDEPCQASSTDSSMQLSQRKRTNAQGTNSGLLGRSRTRGRVTERGKRVTREGKVFDAALQDGD
ncbi:hypothetical protein EV360DRAFT_72663 [Lentinula raphanica]|nr:hypothetical protein EV360DRAFT_72663 [Lentinula raphanica]